VCSILAKTRPWNLRIALDAAPFGPLAILLTPTTSISETTQGLHPRVVIGQIYSPLPSRRILRAGLGATLSPDPAAISIERLCASAIRTSELTLIVSDAMRAKDTRPWSARASARRA